MSGQSLEPPNSHKTVARTVDVALCSGFLIKLYTSSTPLSLLALAGSLPDILWLIFSMVGIEKMKYTDRHVGCFPYDAVFPYSHSLLGEVIIGMRKVPVPFSRCTYLLLLGLVLAGTVSAVRGFRAGTFASLMAASLSHFVLDAAVHRKGI